MTHFNPLWICLEETLRCRGCDEWIALLFLDTEGIQPVTKERLMSVSRPGPLIVRSACIGTCAREIDRQPAAEMGLFDGQSNGGQDLTKVARSCYDPWARSVQMEYVGYSVGTGA